MTHETMTHHEGDDSRRLLLRQRQELRRKLAHHVAVDRYMARNPKAVENREQQQRVFYRLSKRFSFFDQQTCSLLGRLGFRRSIASDMDKWGYERDLKPDLIATQSWCAWQGRDLTEGAGELLYGFDQRRALDRPLSCFAPLKRGLFDQPSFGVVARQQLGLVLSNLSELTF